MNNNKQPISFFLASMPLLVMLLCFLFGGLSWGFSADLIIIAMLLAATLAGFIAMRRGHRWQDLQHLTGQKLAAVLPAILILLMIGMLIGTWVFSGTIPLMVYYGIRLISPEYMVVTAFISSAIMSLFTGTSWGSAGTLGVALVGTSAAIGVPIEMTAGAVISGAYFGDKLSPLSDTTNVCAIAAGADLYRHIYGMLYTTLPSVVIALLVYGFFCSWSVEAGNTLNSQTQRLLLEMQAIYSFGYDSIVLMLPIAIVLIGIVYKFPAVLVMALASLVAMILGVVAIGFSINDAFVAAVRGFNIGFIKNLGLPSSGYSQALLDLLNRGGLYSMVNTLLVVICAFLLAAALELSGCLDVLLNRLISRSKSVFSVIASSMLTGSIVISLTSHGSVTALLVGGLYQKPYQRFNLRPENLSRSLEDSVTIVDPLVPWTVSAVFMASTLGVATIDYLPWAIVCYTGGIFSLLYAALYSKIKFGLLVEQMPSKEV